MTVLEMGSDQEFLLVLLSDNFLQQFLKFRTFFWEFAYMSTMCLTIAVWPLPPSNL